MKLSDAYEKGIFKAQIDLGRFYDQPDEDVWVELREMTNEELNEIAFTQGDSDKEVGKKIQAYLTKHIQNFITDHNYTKDDDETQASKEEVAKHLRSRGFLIGYVVQAWQKKMLTQNQIWMNLESTPNSTSEDTV